MSGCGAERGRAGLAALAAILAAGPGPAGSATPGTGGAPVYDAARLRADRRQPRARRGLHASGRGATQPSSNYSPGLPLLVAGVYEVSGGVHERAARVVLALLGSLAVLFTYLIGPPALAGAVAAGLIGAAAVAIYPALLEYQGMLMSEPLAATLLSGGVLAVLWAGDERGTTAGAGCCPGRCFGALALVRPEYLGRLPCWPARLGLPVLAEGRSGAGLARVAGRGGAAARRPRRRRRCPGRCATRSRSTASCRSRPAAARCSSPAPTCPPTATRKRSAPRCVARHPELFAAGAPQTRCGWSRSSPASPPQRYPELETDQALSRMGREQLWDDVCEEPLEYAGFVAAKVGADLDARAAGRDARAALGGAALGAGRLRPARPRRARWRRRWEALLLGDDLPRDHRAQRPARRLAAARAGDAAAGRRPRRQSAHHLALRAGSSGVA